MKALVKTIKGAGGVVYQEMPDPGSPPPGMILVEVKTVGICGSDIHIFHGTFMHEPPVIMGHEYVVVVVETGADVTKFKKGDKISSEVATEYCGKCRYCRSGDIQQCINRKGMGATRNGCFAKYALVQENVSHLLPDNIDCRLGALVEPVSTCSHCIEFTGIEANDVVVVAGPGPIGLINMQLAKAEGAFVIVTGTTIDEKRLKLAKELGADMSINVQAEDGLKIIRDITEGYGADVFLECSGNARSVALGIEAVRCMGRYTQMGVIGSEISINLDRLANKEIKFTGIKAEKYTSWERAISYIKRGKVNLAKLASHEFGLDKWEEAFAMVESKQGLKVLMHPVE
jgi:L-iditol 2-dehydrogenase